MTQQNVSPPHTSYLFNIPVLLLGKLGSLPSPSPLSPFPTPTAVLIPAPVLPIPPAPPNNEGNQDLSRGIMAGADAVMSAKFVSMAEVTKPML